MQSSPLIVAVRPGSALSARRRLFAALAEAFGVAFTGWPAGGRFDAVIDLGAEGAPDDGVPVLACAAGAATSAERVQMTGAATLDRRLRGLALSTPIAGPAPGGPHADVLATAGTSAVWTRSRGPLPRYGLGVAPPELEPGEGLYALLLRRPLALAALIQFLRELTERTGWRAPPPRAAIVFDDPNLRWRSYGFIDYRRLVEHADEHGYHAAMAMIPLDAGRTHPPTASLFARRRDRLSLVFHGNDHVKSELLAPRDREAALMLTAQALRRVRRFELRSGLSVDRVMMPPHGLCSRHVAAALAALGFDGLCAIHPLPWTEDRPAEQPLLGWRPGEFVDGCAVVPRMHLSSSVTEIAMRAFADQPVVLYGHHEDVAGGLEPLAQAAAAVNRIGDVRWLPVGEIARANHELRVVGARLELRPFARRLQLEPPAGVAEIQVDAPGDAVDPGALVGWSVGEGAVRPFGAAVAGRGTLDIRLHGRHVADPAAVAPPVWRPWPRVRRTATEARDRVLPLAPARARS